MYRSAVKGEQVRVNNWIGPKWSVPVGGSLTWENIIMDSIDSAIEGNS